MDLYTLDLTIEGMAALLSLVGFFGTLFLFSVDVEGFLFHKKAFFLIYLLEGLLLTFDNEVYLMDVNELPDKIKPFVLSLFRYLRRAFIFPVFRMILHPKMIFFPTDVWKFL